MGSRLVSADQESVPSRQSDGQHRIYVSTEVWSLHGNFGNEYTLLVLAHTGLSVLEQNVCQIRDVEVMREEGYARWVLTLDKRVDLRT